MDDHDDHHGTANTSRTNWAAAAAPEPGLGRRGAARAGRRGGPGRARQAYRRGKDSRTAGQAERLMDDMAGLGRTAELMERLMDDSWPGYR